MSRHCGQMQDRRQLLAEALRYATFGILGAVGWSVLARRRRLAREGKCINGGVCRGCEVFESCSLPQALSAKQDLTSIDSDRK